VKRIRRSPRILLPIASSQGHQQGKIATRSEWFPEQDTDSLAGIRRFQRGPEAVLGHGLAHMRDRHDALLIGDDGLAPFEADLGAPHPLEPLQGPLDQDRSSASGHALNLEMGDGKLRRPCGHGQEREPESRKNAEEGSSVHAGNAPFTEVNPLACPSWVARRSAWRWPTSRGWQRFLEAG